MSKFNYVTGYLPVVIDEEIHRKQIKQRIAFGVVAIAGGLLLFSLLGNDTSAQGKYSVLSSSATNTIKASSTLNKLNQTPIQKTEKIAEKKIAAKKQTVLKQTPGAKQSNQKLTTLSTVKPDTQLEAVYQKEVDDLLSRAFSE